MVLHRVLVLVFNFIYNLRFPVGSSVAHILQSRYGRPVLASYRRLERLHWTSHKAALDLTFLNNCKEYDVIPNFLQFKTSLQHFHGSRLHRSFLSKLLNFEIKNKTQYELKVKKDYSRCLSDFKNKVSWLDFKVLLSKINKNSTTKLNRTKAIHDKKLISLGVPIGSGLKAEDVITNLSCKNLSKLEKDALLFGLDFGLPVSKPKFVNHYLSFERLINTISTLPFFSPPNGSINFKEITDKVCSIAHGSYKEAQQFCKSFYGKDKIKALKSLKQDESIIITKPDKGKGVVILDKKDYIDKVNVILTDTTKFVKLDIDPFSYILKLEDKLNRLLRTLKDKVISLETYRYLFASGSVPGILYGLPKIHKLACPIRPILSAIGTFNYNLAKFFVPVLSPCTTNEYTVRNSAAFAHEISNLTYSDSTYMASFDVKSLFTNIPLDETIQICTDATFGQLNKFMNFTKKQFKSLLELAVKECIFLFDNCYYKQIDGVAMGSPLGPTLANAFLCHHEVSWLNDCPQEFKPLLYRRYVDDCFILFKQADHANEFLNYLNLKHANIEFTLETESNCRLPFLDVLVHKHASGFSTSVFRKSTFTGLGLNFLSFVPKIFKLNSIKTLLFRCFSLSSDWNLFHSEVIQLRSYFSKNGYPLHLFEKMLHSFLDKVYSNETIRPSVSKKVMYISLPYYGYSSFKVRKELSKLFNLVYPQVAFRFTFTNSYTIGSFFRYKDRIPKALCSNIVYKFSCSCCNARYIGSSTRSLKIRVLEHKGLSYRTSVPLSKPSFSEIREHAIATGHNFNLDNFEILMTKNDTTSLRIAESLFIHDLKPSLNNYEASVKLFSH